jgi:ribonuclease P protein component
VLLARETARFDVVLRQNEEDLGQRLGLTVSQKVGCAVRRNRVKRLVREVFRLHRELFPSPADIVVIAKTGCPAASFAEVHKELGQAAPAMRAALLGSRAEPRASFCSRAEPRASTCPTPGRPAAAQRKERPR